MIGITKKNKGKKKSKGDKLLIWRSKPLEKVQNESQINFMMLKQLIIKATNLASTLESGSLIAVVRAALSTVQAIPPQIDKARAGSNQQ